MTAPIINCKTVFQAPPFLAGAADNWLAAAGRAEAAGRGAAVGRNGVAAGRSWAGAAGRDGAGRLTGAGAAGSMLAGARKSNGRRGRPISLIRFTGFGC